MFSAENKNDNNSTPSTLILSSPLPPSTSTSVLDVSTPTYSGPLMANVNNWQYPENHRLSIRIDPIVYQDRASLPGLAVLDAPGDGQRVLVTGAGGFIAAHVIELLLRRGYIVRATTRSIINMSTHLAHLSSIVPESDHKLQIVQMRLDEKDEAVWNGIVADCHYVLHLACPVSLFRHDDDAINTQTYISGTCSLLQACMNASTVKRVVLTSCEIAITAGYQQDPTKQHHIFTESDWSQVTPDQQSSISGAYQRAKMACEQAAWSWMDQQCSAHFTLTVLNPSFVHGPFHSSRLHSSQHIILKLLHRFLPAIPDCGLNSVDVRDVAIAHIRAMIAPEAASKRYLISGGWITLKEMAKILDAEFTGRGYNIPTLSAPTPLVQIMSLWDKNAASFLPDCGRSIRVDASSSCRELLMSYTPLPKAIVDEAYSLISLGVARNTLPIVHFRPDGSRVTWRPDDAVTRCNTCGDQFTVIRRKHHCRYCGEIFCRTCSSKRLDKVVPGWFERICDPCYSVHQNPHILRAEEQAALKQNTVSTVIQDQDL